MRQTKPALPIPGNVETTVIQDQLPAASDIPMCDQDSSDLDELIALMHQLQGLDLGLYKRGTVARRVTTRLQRLGYSTYREYLTHLISAPDESRVLLQHITIKVSHFFRTAGLFTLLREKLLPNLLARTRGSEGPRLWSAGCANGEEAYSLAILLEQMCAERSGEVPAATIWATDVDQAALDRAAHGLYPLDAFVETPLEVLERYFVPRAGRLTPQYELLPTIRERVTFSQHNLLSGSPPWNGHQPGLILCRNVLIYLVRAAQMQLYRLLLETLAPGGYLCLGESEQLPDELQSQFHTVDHRYRIYRKL